MQPFEYFSVSYLTKRQTVDALRSMQLTLKPQATILEKPITAQDGNQFIHNFIKSASSLPRPQNSVTPALDRTIHSTFWNSFHLIRIRVILQRFLAPFPSGPFTLALRYTKSQLKMFQLRTVELNEVRPSYRFVDQVYRQVARTFVSHFKPGCITITSHCYSPIKQ